MQSCPALHVALPHVHSTLLDAVPPVFEHAPPVLELRLAVTCDKCRQSKIELLSKRRHLEYRTILRAYSSVSGLKHAHQLVKFPQEFLRTAHNDF